MVFRKMSWILVVVMVGILVFPLAGLAQPPVNPGQVPTPQPPKQPPSGNQPAQPETERRPPAPEYAIALISTFLVLVIVCKPSRKSTS
jgi:hypothetical protein